LGLMCNTNKQNTPINNKR